MSPLRTSTLVFALALATTFAAPAILGADGAAAFSFVEQSSGGHAVIIASADLPEGGFLAIHDATLLSKADPLGSVVGVSEFLAPGHHANVRVYLARALVGANETLIAMPHKDTNGNHRYEFASSLGKDDGPYTGGPQALAGLTGPLAGFNGISATPQKVNNTASLSASAQVTSGRSIIVDFVDLSQDGYVAIHDATLVQGAGASGVNTANLFTSVAGETDLLKAGVYHDVVVEVGHNCAGCSPHPNLNGTLIPMAHKETNGNAVYDFITTNGKEDGPFTGQPGTPLTSVIDIIATTNGTGARTVFMPQATGGHVVIVPEVFLPDGGFAAVHDSTLLSAGDPLGSVRGVSEFLTPGVHRNVSIELSTNLTGAPHGALNASDTLIAMPHKDTNANMKYDFVTSKGADDGPYTGGPNALAGLTGTLAGFNGISAVPANATLAAGVLIEANQFSTDGRNVKLLYADFSTAGFIALHDETLLANVGTNVLTSVVGVSNAFTPGLYRNVTVTVGNNCAGCNNTHALNTSQTLVAMPHKDSNGNGVYDFITSKGADDGPFVGATGNANTVTASNIVVSVGRFTTPILKGGVALNGTGSTNSTGTTNSSTTNSSSNTTTTTTPSPTVSTTTTPGSTNATTTTTTTPQQSVRGTPGASVGLVAVAAALGVALLALRRRRSS